MIKKITRLWYASYGSNLLENRFLCYIRGGTPPGAQRNYPGCTDRTLPGLNKPVTINAELYFARQSKTWNAGGVGFIKPTTDPGAKTLGRMYLISTAQFMELVKQEIRWEGDFQLDMTALIRNSSLILNDSSWYNKILLLGTQNGDPVVSFTNQNYLEGEINSPDEHYLGMIINGLRESWNLTNPEIETYLRSKPGIKNTELQQQLPGLISKH